jgi:aspartyl protease family protein
MTSGMKVAIIIVTFVGIGIGLALPGSKRAPAAAVPAAAAAVDANADRPRPTVLEREDNGHFFTVADINGEPIRMVVDTGATSIALTMEDAKRIGVDFDPNQFDVVGTGASGDIRGQEVLLDDVVLDGKRVSGIHALVLDGLTISLLGQNYLRHYDISITGDSMTIK